MTESEMLAVLFNSAALVVWAVLMLGGLGALLLHQLKQRRRDHDRRRLERLRERNATRKASNAKWRKARGL